LGSKRQLKVANIKKKQLQQEIEDATNRKKELNDQVEALKPMLEKRRKLIQQMKGVMSI
jgi:predicted  nucleic acid-binding Zn-ribbon protein